MSAPTSSSGSSSSGSSSSRPVAVVTGASRGIGKACAISLAEAGYDIVGAARTLVDGSAMLDDGSTAVPGGLDTTIAAVEAAGGRGLAVKLDLLDRSTLDDVVQQTLETFGRIDVLLNNGIYQGPGTMHELVDLDDDELARMFEGNVFAQLALIRKVVPTMQQQGSGIVLNMVSATAFIDPPGRIGSGGWGIGYAMTKAAFARSTPLLQVELGHLGLRFFSVEPGRVITERQAMTSAGRGWDDHFAGAPPEVIGAAVRWLVTDPEADDLKGQVVYAQRECKRRGLLPGWPPPKA